MSLAISVMCDCGKKHARKIRNVLNFIMPGAF